VETETTISDVTEEFKWPRSFGYLGENSILVFSGTQNWRHDSGIAAASNFWATETDKNGVGLFTTEHPEIFDPQYLSKFSVIVFNNMTGLGLLNESQKTAIQSFAESGGGLILQHGSGDGSAGANWPWYRDLVGTKFIGHPADPQFQNARVVTLAENHPVMFGIGPEFYHTEEWYSFDGSVSGDVVVLAGLDESSYSPRNDVYGDVSDLRMGPEPSDHPIIWAKCPGEGRMVYSALGHHVQSYETEAHLTLLRNAMAWVRKETDPQGESCPS
jgi:type 1 glutamine amidotransferase